MTDSGETSFSNEELCEKSVVTQNTEQSIMDGLVKSQDCSERGMHFLEIPDFKKHGTIRN